MIEVKSNVVGVKSNVVEIKRAQRGQEQFLLQLLSQTSQDQAERRTGKGQSEIFPPTIRMGLTDQPDVTELKQILDEKNQEDLRHFLNPDWSVFDQLKEL